MNMSRRTNIAAVLVRLSFLIISVAGLVVLVVGVGMAGRVIANDTADKQSGNVGKVAKISKLIVLAPFLLCLVSAVPLYLLNLIHIIVHYKNKNWGHVVHSLLMCYYPPFVAGASVGLFVGAAYSYAYYIGVEKNTTSWFHSTLVEVFDKQYVEVAKVLTAGAGISFASQWIVSFIWPLFNYERRSYRTEYRELEESTNFR